MTRTFAVALGLALVGCGRSAPAPPPPLPEASAVDLAGVDGALEGTIAGEAFAAVDARFRVIRYPGRERIDLVFADRAIERCGLPIARDDARVWIRVPGVTSLEPGELSLLAERSDDEDAGAPALEVHYERPNGTRGFTESHRGIVRLEIASATTELVEGRIHACFADGTHSCVAGRFRAAPCRSRVDGRSLREPPGLDDEALEPLPSDRTDHTP